MTEPGEAVTRFKYATCNAPDGKNVPCEIITTRLEHHGSNIMTVTAKVLDGGAYLAGDIITAPSIRFSGWRREA